MRPRKTLVAALISVAVTALLLGLSRTEIGRIFEFKTLDYRARTRPSGTIDSRVLVVAIDDRSLDVAGRWPWPRDYHALLLQILAEARPRAVGFDMCFSEPDHASADGDRLLAQQAGALSNVIFGAVARRNTAGAPLLPSDLSARALPRVVGTVDEVVGSDDAQLPIESLRRAGAVGFINADRDADGVLRRVSMVVRVGNKLYPSLILQTVCATFGVTSDQVEVVLGEAVILHAKNGAPRYIPIDASGRFFVNSRYRPQDFERGHNAVNYLTILQSHGATPEGRAPSWDLAQLAGRTVLVGLSATGVDVAPTPIDDNTPLVFAQANAVSNILQQDFLRQVPPGLFWPLATLGLFGLALFNVYNTSAIRSALFSIVVILAYVAAAAMSFRYYSLWIELFWPVIGMSLVFSSTTAYQFFTEEREKRMVKHAFQRYLSPKVMTEVLANPNKLVLGGVRRKMTVLFSDIRGFTAYSEKRPPEEVVPLLNELQDELSNVIFRHDGTLNKYMGDAILAFWGAPGEPTADDAWRAVSAAHEMVEVVQQLGTKWRERGIEPFGIGVGINTGEMIVGNMGSTRHFDYTVIGDEVNLGARLETLTRQYDANVILSEATWQEVKGRVRTKELGEVTVRGRTRPVRIYTLDSPATPTPDSRGLSEE